VSELLERATEQLGRLQDHLAQHQTADGSELDDLLARAARLLKGLPNKRGSDEIDVIREVLGLLAHAETSLARNLAGKPLPRAHLAEKPFESGERLRPDGGGEQ
jgi:hypothetical protein